MTKAFRQRAFLFGVTIVIGALAAFEGLGPVIDGDVDWPVALAGVGAGSGIMWGLTPSAEVRVDPNRRHAAGSRWG